MAFKENVLAGARKFGRVVRNIFIVLLLIGIGILSYFYYADYSEGICAGVVIKMSTRGVVFKTTEGQLDLNVLGASDPKSVFKQSFEFSVLRSDEKVKRELEEVALTGERVNLVYAEKYFKVFWRGDTKYFVTKVDRLGQLLRINPQS